jgi:arylsulfatase A-like enzyme
MKNYLVSIGEMLLKKKGSKSGIKWLGLGAGLFTSSLISNAASQAVQPNIVFILLDDMGWDEPGCYGGRTKLETPNIDRLAREGMRFTHFTSYPYCSPSRAAFITGRHSYRTGITANVADPGGMGRRLLPSEIPVPKGLGRAGYKSAIFGKLHLHWNSAANTDYAQETLGFDESFLWLGTPHPESEKVPGGGAKIGRPAGGMLADHFNPPWYRNGVRLPEIVGYDSDIMTKEAIAYIKKTHDKPFLLWLPYFAIHEPFQSPQRWQEKWNARREELRPVLKECVQRTRAWARAEGKPDDLKNYNPPLQQMVNRAAMVSTVDENIGWLLDALEEEGLAENTLVIFTSDNGPHPIAGSGKAHMCDAGIREPLIVRWPDHIEPGTICDALAESVDIYPTLMDVAGSDMPEEIPFDGQSLLPWLQGASPSSWRDVGFSDLKGVFGVFTHDWFMEDVGGREQIFYARPTPPTPLERSVDPQQVPRQVRALMKSKAEQCRDLFEKKRVQLHDIEKSEFEAYRARLNAVQD